jgi:hypothetical protein
VTPTAAGVAAAECIQTNGVLCPATAALLGAVSFYIACSGDYSNVLRIYLVLAEADLVVGSVHTTCRQFIKQERDEGIGRGC